MMSYVEKCLKRMSHYVSQSADIGVIDRCRKSSENHEICSKAVLKHQPTTVPRYFDFKLPFTKDNCDDEIKEKHTFPPPSICTLRNRCGTYDIAKPQILNKNMKFQNQLSQNYIFWIKKPSESLSFDFLMYN